MAQPNEEAEDPIIKDWAKRDAVWKEAWQAKFRTMADLEECLRVIGRRPLNPNLSVAKQQEDWDLRNDTHFGDEAELIYSFGPRPVEDAAHDSRVLDRMSRMPTKANKVPLTYPPGTERTTLVDQPARADGKKADAAGEFGEVTAEMPIGAAPTEDQRPPEEQGADLPAVVPEPREYRLLKKDRVHPDDEKVPTRRTPAAPRPPRPQPKAAAVEDTDPPLSEAVRDALLAAREDSQVGPLPDKAALEATRRAWLKAEEERRAARNRKATVVAQPPVAAAAPHSTTQQDDGRPATNPPAVEVPTSAPPMTPTDGMGSVSWKTRREIQKNVFGN
jgi:hypothetical protein